MNVCKEALPLVVRLVAGDITRARASLLVVNHFNGLPPGGAEAAIDRELGGVLSRLAARGALDSHFGGITLLPLVHARLAATAVMVVSLGDVERFHVARLPEVGLAIVEMMASLGYRDAATVLHGAGKAGVTPGEAARYLMEGILSGIALEPGAESIRELMIVEDLDRFEPGEAAARKVAIAQGIRKANGPPRVHCYFERWAPLPGVAVEGKTRGVTATEEGGIPPHVDLGFRLENRTVHMTLSGQGSGIEYAAPLELNLPVLGRIRKAMPRLMNERGEGDRQVELLKGLGSQLFHTFGLERFWLPYVANLSAKGDRRLVLSIDSELADLPWELLYDGEHYLSREWEMSRVLSVRRPARPSGRSASDSVFHMLLISDPTMNLPSAEKEAKRLIRSLALMGPMQVRHLSGGEASYANVTAALEERPYDVLHYAGHFEHDSLIKGQSGLVLADGILTSDDLSTRRYVPQFCFVNACESSRGTEEGDAAEAAGVLNPYGLAAALLERGVRAFLGSQWVVDSRAAWTFAVTLYGALVKRKTLGQAVQQARRAVVRRHGEGQPAWAGYCVYGVPWLRWVLPE